jgi:hypothetical protein
MKKTKTIQEQTDRWIIKRLAELFPKKYTKARCEVLAEILKTSRTPVHLWFPDTEKARRPKRKPARKPKAKSRTRAKEIV